MSRAFALLGLLRRRRELPPREVARLLAGLPEILDATGASSGDLLRALRVDFFSNVEGIDPAAMPVGEWPGFDLVLQEEEESDGSTVLLPVLPSADAPARLSGLVYELLGGPRQQKGLVSPLASLNEAGNAVLRRGMKGGAFADCGAFWRAWLETLENEVAGWRIPAGLRGGSVPGDVLELASADPRQPPVRLVARTEFRIGRSRRECDWPARVVVRGKYDASASERVSRVHVVGAWLPEGPAFRDGNGGRPSANGTVFGGNALETGKGLPLGKGGVLTLGGSYRLEVRRVHDAGFCGAIGSGISETDVNERRSGAVFFRPLDGLDTVRDAVWLRSAIAFGISPAGPLEWRENGGSDAAGWLVHQLGQFWIANRNLGTGALVIGEVPLSPGEIAPLVSGQTVVIGASRFTARVVAAAG